jgi:hypothetical protein
MECRIIPTPQNKTATEIEEMLQPGDLVENPYHHPSMADSWLFRCPQCSKVWGMRVPAVHQIVQRQPLTASPSWLCPAGCHYFIRNGKVA